MHFKWHKMRSTAWTACIADVCLTAAAIHETFCNLYCICRSELAPAYVRLLRDTEAEVRVTAAGKVASFSKLLMPPMIVSQILPCVSELAMDSSQFVRAALAGVVMELAPVLGKQATIDHLVPVFLTLLKDAYPDVRLNVISKLDQVNQVRCHATGLLLCVALMTTRLFMGSPGASRS